MLAEKKSTIYREEFSFTWSFDVDRAFSGTATTTSETITLTAVCELNYTTDWATFGYGMRAMVQAISTPDGTGDETILVLDCPLLGLIAHEITLDGSAVVTSGTCLIQLRDRIRYSRSNQTHRLKVSDLRVDIDGVNKYASGAQTFDGPMFQAAGVPIIGGMPKFYGGVTSDIVPAFGADAPIITGAGDSYEVSVRGEATATCTWRRQKNSGDAWTYFDIAIRDDGIAYGTGDCDTEAIATPSGTTTNAVRIDATLETASGATFLESGVECPCPEGTEGTPSIHNKFESFVRYKGTNNAIRFIPNHAKLITRMVEADHAERVIRGGTPEVRSGSNWEYAKDDDILVSHTIVTDATTVHVEQAQDIQTITGTAGSFEDMNDWTSYCHTSYGGFSYTAERVYFVQTTPGNCTPTFISPDAPNPCLEDTVDSKCYISKSYAFPSYVQDREGGGGNLAIWPELDHSDDEARKINTVDAPLWNFLDYFPDDNIDSDEDEEFDQQTEWQVDGAAVSSLYWVSLGHQWDGARMTLISAPLGVGKHGTYISEEYLGKNALSNWVGSEILKKDSTLIAASKTLTSANSAQFTATNATLSFGPSVTITPDPGATEVTLVIDVSNWTVDPRQFAQLANKFRMQFSGAGITSAAAFLVGVDNSELEVYDELYVGAVDETIPYGAGPSVKYAGSWSQELNAAVITSDLGTDSIASGISAATMGDAERITGFQLLPGRGVKALKFVFQIA